MCRLPSTWSGCCWRRYRGGCPVKEKEPLIIYQLRLASSLHKLHAQKQTHIQLPVNQRAAFITILSRWMRHLKENNCEVVIKSVLYYTVFMLFNAVKSF